MVAILQGMMTVVPFFGWPLLGKDKFASGVWRVVAMYSPSICGCNAAHLGEVRMYQVRSVECDLVAWGPTGVLIRSRPPLDVCLGAMPTDAASSLAESKCDTSGTSR